MNFIMVHGLNGKEQTMHHFKLLGSLVMALMLGSTLFHINSVSAETRTGGRFMLMSHEGKVITDQEFRGKFMLVFFGYTFCPDICPTSMMEVGETMKLLGKDGADLQPLFITVDPERDTVSVLREYVGNFHDKIIGLTGSKAAISSVTGKYRVKYARVAASKDTPEYTMDHTAALFLMGPQGEYLTRFGYGTPAKKIAETIKTKMKMLRQN
jgi:protein SCO1/2